MFYRVLLYVSFDENYARTFTRRVNLFKYVSVGLTGLAIVFNIRMAGVILIISLLTIPANIIMLFTRKYLQIILWSFVVSFIGISGGFRIIMGHQPAYRSSNSIRACCLLADCACYKIIETKKNSNRYEFI